LKAKIGYPTLEEEAAVLSRFQIANPLDRLQSVMGTAEILDLQALCRRIFIEDSVRNYIVAVNSATRSHKDIKLEQAPAAPWLCNRPPRPWPVFKAELCAPG